MNNNLEVKNITLSYGQDIVIDDLSVDFQFSSFIGLIGANGAGKTTLMCSMSGQFIPDLGEITFDNYNIYENNLKFKENMGYVHEDPFFYQYMTVVEFLHFVAGVKKIQKTEIGNEIVKVLESVCLIEQINKSTASLSMGMKKKLAIASALLGQPKIIFLDEALNGIDIESTFTIKQTLSKYVKGGATIILSSHVLEVLEKICDRYIVIKDGRIIADIDAVAFKQSTAGEEGSHLESHIIELLNSGA